MLIQQEMTIAASPDVIQKAFWTLSRWQEVWAPMQKITILYQDDFHQEIVMQVNRDGVEECNRTIRFRKADNREIAFFSPLPPPMMILHRGVWRLQGDNTMTRVTAIREFKLIREDEDDIAYAHRTMQFADNFNRRLLKILQSFKHNIEMRGNQNA